MKFDEGGSVANQNDNAEEGLNYRHASRRTRQNRKRLNKQTLDAFSESQGEGNLEMKAGQKSQRSMVSNSKHGATIDTAR